MRRFLYSALLLAFTNLGVAQETPLEAGLEATYSESVDLFEDGLYAAARPMVSLMPGYICSSACAKRCALECQKAFLPSSLFQVYNTSSPSS